MSPRPQELTSLARHLRRVTLVCALLVAAIGVWRLTGVGAHRCVELGAALLVLAAALLLRGRPGTPRFVLVVLGLAVFVTSIGGIFTEPVRAWTFGALSVLGLALIHGTGAGWRTVRFEAMLVIPAMLAIVFLGFGASSEDLSTPGIPTPNAIAIVAASLGLLVARTEFGFARLVVSPTEGGRLTRLMLAAFLVIVLIADGVRLTMSAFGVREYAADRLSSVIVIGSLLGTVMRLAVVLDRNLAQRSRAQAESRRAREVVASMVDAASDAFVRIDREGHVVGMNAAAEELYGWEAHELTGRLWYEVLPAIEPDERELFVEASALLLDSGAPAEALARRKDGTVIEVEFSAARLEDGFMSVARDVSARKHVERTAREQSDRLVAVSSAHTRIAAHAGSLAEAMEVVADAARALVGADGGVIEQIDGDEVYFRAVVGSTAEWRGTRVPIEGSLSGLAITEGRTQRSDDTSIDDRVDPAAARLGIRSMICVPLRHGSRTVAVLKVVSAVPNAFGTGDEQALDLVAGLAGSVLHRAQTEHRLAVFNAVANAADAGASLDEGVDGALRVIGEHLGWEAGALWLETDDRSRLECTHNWFASDIPAGDYVDALADEAVWAGEPGDPVATVHNTCRELWLGEPGDARRAAAAQRLGIRRALIVPVLLRGRTVGAIELVDRRPHAEDQTEVELLRSIGTQLAQFAERRRAEIDAATQAENLSAVVALSQMLAGIPAMQVRHALCEALRELARSDQVTLLEPDGNGRLLVTAQSGDAGREGHMLDLAVPSLVTQVFHEGYGRYVDQHEVSAGADDELVLRSAMSSGYIEPILRDGVVVGIMTVTWSAESARLASGIGELISLLAAEASTALALSDLVRVLDARARTDELTGLPNRRSWDEELPRELARSQRSGEPVTVAMVDIDHFKRYNDTFGHPAGDRLLRAAAANWAARLRATDMIARYGGEEFSIVLPGCDIASAERVLDDLRLAMPDGTTCSMGVAVWNGTEEPETLVSRADEALYAAKRRGRNCITAAPVV